MKYTIFVLLLASASATMGQEFVSIWEAPTRGGTEGGIPGLRRPFSTEYTSYGYYLALLSPEPYAPQRPTHLIVVGPGGDSGLLFQLSAAARAKKYREVFPDHQVLMLASDEFGTGENQRQASKWGFQILRSTRADMTVDALVYEASNLKAIASLDVFAHANEESGVRLAETWGPEHYSVQSLRRRFTQEAWAIIHGCNTGWRMAPALARYWNIPVAGSFTGTHFERYHSRGDFYPYDELLAPPGEFPPTNTTSFDRPEPCATGACLRMKPDAHAYDGIWGRREDGLNFYKYFCPGMDSNDCSRRMALSLLGFIGTRNIKRTSSLADFKTVMYEFMCSIHKDKDWRTRCIRATENGLARGIDIYSPFWGRSLQCDFADCRTTDEGEPTTTYMNEIKAYLRGFTLMNP